MLPWTWLENSSEGNSKERNKKDRLHKLGYLCNQIMKRKMVYGSQLWNLRTNITLLPVDLFPDLHSKLLSDQQWQPGFGAYYFSYHHHFARKRPCVGTTKPAETFVSNSAQETSRINIGQRTWCPLARGLAYVFRGPTTPRSPLKQRQSLVLLAVQSQELSSASLTPRGCKFLWWIWSSTSRRCLYTQSATSVSYAATKETSWSRG